MISHFLKSALRQINRQPLFAAINLFGLATAMAVCFMIILFVYHELSFDRFHEDAGNIYRVNMNVDIRGDVRNEAVTSHAVGPDLLDYFPDVTNMTRIAGWQMPVNIWQNDEYITISNAMYAESSFFEVFSFNLKKGDPATALSQPFSAVITEELADRLFPGQEPMGKIISMDNRRDPYLVTGIIENCPPNSHLQYNMLRSYASLRETSIANFYEWDANINAFTYVLLANETDMDLLNEKTEQLAYEKLNYKFEGVAVQISFEYFPVVDIRLHSRLNQDMVETGTMSKVWIFSVVAIFVLFIAGFNYVNLTIARSGKRAREVGVRKVLGADLLLLKKQFYLESIFTSTVSFLAALLLAEIALPLFNNIMDTNLRLMGQPAWLFLLSLVIFTGLFGFLAGVYPSMFMSRFQPVKILKGEFWSKHGGFQPRNLLLLIQFIVSLGLIVSTLVILFQVRFLINTDLGFDDDQLLVVSAETLDDAALLRHSLSDYQWLDRHAISTGFPAGAIYVEGMEAEDISPGIMAQRLWVDHHFLSTMGIRLSDGRFFETDGGLETGYSVINEAFARKANWAEPLGKVIGREGRSYRVIGVIEDFHMQSLHNEIEPIVISTLQSRPGYMPESAWVLIRYTDAGSAEVLRDITTQWASLFPDKTLNYYFIPELIKGMYANEYSFGRLFLSFTVLAIVIAMLGVLGLTAFLAQQRQKEISIRKVLGAQTPSLLFMMSAEIMKWVLVAAIIALPLSWYFMDKWLAGFPYAISFPFWTMIVALATMLITALIIVLTQSIHTIQKNPARVLSFE